jgi:hypothetical protein
VLQFLGRFRNPLIIILLVPSAVSAATGDASALTETDPLLLVEADPPAAHVLVVRLDRMRRLRTRITTQMRARGAA